MSPPKDASAGSPEPLSGEGRPTRNKRPTKLVVYLWSNFLDAGSIPAISTHNGAPPTRLAGHCHSGHLRQPGQKLKSHS